MIGKIKKGRGFAGLTKYIWDKEGAELICTNMAGGTPQNFYRQLGATRQLNPRVQSPVSHISISFAPGERPDKEQLEQIVEGTLAGMGFDKNLYFAATHNDRDHFHLHIAASRINSEGECVSDWYDFRRLEETLRSLEQQFDLTHVPCSREVNRRAPSTGQKRRMMREQQEFEQGLRDKPADKSAVEKIQDAINTAIEPGISVTQLLKKLDKAGVETKVKVTREGVIQGISYSIDGVAFQGSKLGRSDRACTLQGVQQRRVSFDLERDAKAIASHATSNSQRGTRSPSKLIRLIQSHPKNLSLTLSPSNNKTLGSGGNEDTDTTNTSDTNPTATSTEAATATATTTATKAPANTTATVAKKSTTSDTDNGDGNNNETPSETTSLEGTAQSTKLNLLAELKPEKKIFKEPDQISTDTRPEEVDRDQETERLTALSTEKIGETIASPKPSFLKSNFPKSGSADTANQKAAISSICSISSNTANTSNTDRSNYTNSNADAPSSAAATNTCPGDRSSAGTIVSIHMSNALKPRRDRTRSVPQSKLERRAEEEQPPSTTNTTSTDALPDADSSSQQELLEQTQPTACNALQLELAREILPIAAKAFNYILDNAPHRAIEGDNYTQVEVASQYNLIVQDKPDGTAAYSVVATDKRGELIRFEKEEIVLAQKLKADDLKVWKNIESQLDKLFQPSPTATQLPNSGQQKHNAELKTKQIEF